MKKIQFKYLFMLLITIATLSPIGAAKASIPYPEYHPQDLINDELLYNEVDALTIEGNESQSLSQIDFNKFSHLKEIRLVRTSLLDGSVIDLNIPINSLDIRDSIINLATIDLNDFNSINLLSSFIIGDKTENSKIHNINPLNEEYKLELNNIYGLQDYEPQINTIAKEIYNQSDGTPEDIIRLVTLYVIEHMEYDYENAYTNLPFYESIIDHGKGACAHYSNFESRLLNKLGILAIDISGCTDINDCMNKGHAWDLVYFDNNWYYIDPTWIDSEQSIEALRTKDYQSSSWLSSLYMIPTNNGSSSYATQRKPDFTMQDSIPEEYRISKISILNENQPENEDKENEIAEPSSSDKTIEAPNAGLFTPNNSSATINIFIINTTAPFITASLILTLISRINKKDENINPKAK